MNTGRRYFIHVIPATSAASRAEKALSAVVQGTYDGTILSEEAVDTLADTMRRLLDDIRRDNPKWAPVCVHEPTAAADLCYGRRHFYTSRPAAADSGGGMHVTALPVRRDYTAEEGGAL